MPYNRRVSEPLIPRDELRASLEARRELGPEFDDELVEAFASRIEQRLQGRPQPARAQRSRDHETAIAIVSMGVAIPLIAIAGNFAGLAGIVAVCAALVLVNVVSRR
jgi:hypothetical protein